MRGRSVRPAAASGSRCAPFPCPTATCPVAPLASTCSPDALIVICGWNHPVVVSPALPFTLIGPPAPADVRLHARRVGRAERGRARRVDPRGRDEPIRRAHRYGRLPLSSGRGTAGQLRHGRARRRREHLRAVAAGVVVDDDRRGRPSVCRRQEREIRPLGVRAHTQGGIAEDTEAVLLRKALDDLAALGVHDVHAVGERRALVHEHGPRRVQGGIGQHRRNRIQADPDVANDVVHRRIGVVLPRDVHVEGRVPGHRDALRIVRRCVRQAGGRRVPGDARAARGERPGDDEHVVLVEGGRTRLRIVEEIRDRDLVPAHRDRRLAHVLFSARRKRGAGIIDVDQCSNSGLPPGYERPRTMLNWSDQAPTRLPSGASATSGSREGCVSFAEMMWAADPS